MTTLLQDLRYAFRMLVKNPGFTAVAVLTLALGIGANTTIFSVINATLLRPLAFPEPDRLVLVWETFGKGPDNINIVSAPNVWDFKQHAKSFEAMAIFDSAGRGYNLSPTGTKQEAEQVSGLRVSAEFFPTLGVKPLLGRTFLPEEETLGRDREVVLSYGLWKSRYSGDPALIGRTIKIDGEDFTVVGVMPREFQWQFWSGPRQLWVPVGYTKTDFGRGDNSFICIARLKPGVSIAQARAEMETIASGVRQQYPKEDANMGATVTPLGEYGMEGLRTTMLALLAAVGFVLLIACVNVANLMLARGATRGEELDVRTDLFSLGCVLYEMATGQLAFSGNTFAVVFDSILNKDPISPRSLNPHIPPPLEQIIFKAMEKDREVRYQHASDIRADLKRLKRDTSSGRPVVAPVSSPAKGVGAVNEPPLQDSDSQMIAGLVKRHKGSILTASLIVGVIVASLGYTIYRRRGSATQDAKTPSGRERVPQIISHWNKPMNGATLSPDGQRVAFDSPVDGTEQVFIMFTSNGDTLQLTRDEADKTVDNFSIDGSEIYFERTLGLDETLGVTLAGTLRRVASGRSLAPSPDGRSFFYLKSDKDRTIFRAEKSGLGEGTVSSFDNPPLAPVSVLSYPDGKDLLVATKSRFSSEEIQLHKVSVPGHTALDVGAISAVYLPQMVWAEPGKSLLFSRTVNGLTNLWKYDLADRTLTQLTMDPGPDFSPMPDPAGKGIYYVNGKESGSLTAYHPSSRRSVDLASDNVSQPAVSPDGKRVMYIKVLGHDTTELWVSDIEGGNKLKLKSSRALETGDWSPDGSQITFTDSDGVETKGYIVGIDGIGLRQVAPIEGDIDWITWSAIGKDIYVSTEKRGLQDTIWKANADGSSAQRFMDNCCIVTDAAPDGNYLLAFVDSGDDVGIYEVSISNKKRMPLLPGVVTFGPRFAPDGKSFLFGGVSSRGVTFYRQAWRNGQMIGKPAVALKLPFTFSLVHDDLSAFDFSRDLSSIVFFRPGGEADLYLLNLPHY